MTPTTTVKAAACSHCGSARQVAAIRELINANKRRPIVGLGRMLVEMKMTYGAERLMAVCPRCMCITSDMTSNPEH